MLETVEMLLSVGALGVFGLIAGSFAGAQTWRIRAYQLRDEDRRLTELRGQRSLPEEIKQEKAELMANRQARKIERRRLDGLLGGVRQDYSRCLACQHRLAWYDLLPVVSWLSTGGKCRYCRAPIGYFEPLMEIGLAGFFVLSYILWPVELVSVIEISQFVIWLLSGVALAILFAYDAKWFLLPDVAMLPFIGLAAIFAGLELFQAGWTLEALLSLLGALAVLSGLYWLLHTVSRGTWVGYGDVTLGAGLALLLGRFELAIVALFLANLVGSLLVLPQLIRRQLKPKSPIPFGPLMIVGTILAIFWGKTIVDWYINLL